ERAAGRATRRPGAFGPGPLGRWSAKELPRYCPRGPKTVSAEAPMFQALPERSVMPAKSTTLTLYCAPGTEPGATMLGFAVIVIVSIEFVCPPKGVVVTQVAFVLQMMSTSVSVFPPVHGGCVGAGVSVHC